MERDKTMSDIIKAREIIKKKFNAFRRGEQESAEELEKQFKPVTEPLKAILEAQTANIEEKKKKKQGDDEDDKRVDVKDEVKTEAVEDDYDDNEGVSARDELYDVLEKKYGPDVTSHMYDKLTDGAKDYDNTYGLRKDKTKGWMIGNQPVSFDTAGRLNVKGMVFEPTPGFLELIFKKVPQGYTDEDKNNYRNVLELTNGHKRLYNEENVINASKAKKYRDIISELFPAKKKRSRQGRGRRGSGVFVPHEPSSERVFVYWDDPNELVERLALLVASKNAGHTGHDREILSLVEELREAGYIV